MRPLQKLILVLFTTIAIVMSISSAFAIPLQADYQLPFNGGFDQTGSETVTLGTNGFTIDNSTQKVGTGSGLGTNQVLQFTGLSGINTFSLAFWARVDSYDGMQPDSRRLVDNLNLRYVGGYGWSFDGYCGGGSFNSNLEINDPSSGWVHVVVVQKSDGLKLYVNGNNIYNNSATDCANGAITQLTFNGNNGVAWTATKDYDDLRFYKNVELTDSQVAELYNNNSGDESYIPVCPAELNASITDNISLTKDCRVNSWTFNVPNTELNCNGYTITGTNNSFVSFFYIGNVDNITIKNCRLNNTLANQAIFWVQNATNILIKNNKVIDHYQNTAIASYGKFLESDSSENLILDGNEFKNINMTNNSNSLIFFRINKGNNLQIINNNFSNVYIGDFSTSLVQSVHLFEIRNSTTLFENNIFDNTIGKYSTIHFYGKTLILNKNEIKNLNIYNWTISPQNNPYFLDMFNLNNEKIDNLTITNNNFHDIILQNTTTTGKYQLMKIQELKDNALYIGYNNFTNIDARIIAISDSPTQGIIVEHNNFVNQTNIAQTIGSSAKTIAIAFGRVSNTTVRYNNFDKVQGLTFIFNATTTGLKFIGNNYTAHRLSPFITAISISGTSPYLDYSLFENNTFNFNQLTNGSTNIQFWGCTNRNNKIIYDLNLYNVSNYPIFSGSQQPRIAGICNDTILFENNIGLPQIAIPFSTQSQNLSYNKIIYRNNSFFTKASTLSGFVIVSTGNNQNNTYEIDFYNNTMTGYGNTSTLLISLSMGTPNYETTKTFNYNFHDNTINNMQSSGISQSFGKYNFTNTNLTLNVYNNEFKKADFETTLNTFNIILSMSSTGGGIESTGNLIYNIYNNTINTTILTSQNTRTSNNTNLIITQNIHDNTLKIREYQHLLFNDSYNVASNINYYNNQYVGFQKIYICRGRNTGITTFDPVNPNDYLTFEPFTKTTNYELETIQYVCTRGNWNNTILDGGNTFTFTKINMGNNLNWTIKNIKITTPILDNYSNNFINVNTLYYNATTFNKPDYTKNVNNALDLTNVPLYLSNTFGLINWTNNINLQIGADFDNNVQISNKTITVNEANLNSEATLTYYNTGITNLTTLKVYKNNILTTNYTNPLINADNITITVPTFSTYTISENCIPNYYCSYYASCQIVNTLPCMNVTDQNSCGTPYNPLNYSDYNIGCNYTAPPSNITTGNYTDTDLPKVVIDGFVKLIIGFATTAILIGIGFILYFVRKKK